MGVDMITDGWALSGTWENGNGIVEEVIGCVWVTRAMAVAMAMAVNDSQSQYSSSSLCVQSSLIVIVTVASIP
jgi:hypothetical protein